MTDTQAESKADEVRRKVDWLEHDSGVRSRVEAALAYIRAGGKGVRPRDHG